MNEAPRMAPDVRRQAGLDRSAPRGRLERLVDVSRLALLWERLWPGLVPPLLVAAVFVAVSLMGAWLALPPAGRMIGCAVALVAFALSLVPLLRLTLPVRRQALARLDRDAPVSHRPATALDDKLALGLQDPATRALWEAHRRRAEADVEALKVSAPRPGMAGRDRFAVRAAVILALVTGAFVAGPDMGHRLTSAFEWKGVTLGGADWRIDGWIDPPHYTRLPPVILDFKAAGVDHGRVRVPVKSTLVVRAAGKASLEVTAASGLEPLAVPAASKPDLKESRFTISASTRLRVAANGAVVSAYDLEVIPDRAPDIKFSGPPQPNARGSMVITYTASDDYGLSAAEGQIERADATATSRSLVTAPRVPLSLPAGAAPAGEMEETKTTVDLSAHPWAGGRVKLTLVARDEIGQEGRSESLIVTLPQRPFTKPLARALVEQRRNLVIEPERRQRVQTALDALLIAPDQFYPKEMGVYLGMRIGSERLRRAKSDADLLEVADYLWNMALTIEDGDLSDSERALRAAQEALREALERGASEEEIKKLTQDLRAALDRFLRDFAERNRNNQAQNERGDQNARTITPDDLKNLLDRIEELARQGAHADAQRLLDELRSIMENLQMARPGRQADPMARELNRALDELDQMTREQQALRDDTFRDNQRREGNRAQRQQRGQQGQRGQQQRGQQGQRGQKGQQGQQGEQQADGQDGDGDQAGEGLSGRQQALRQRLEELKRRMRGLGMQGEQGLDDAEQAMRDAEGSLGQGQPGSAVDAQGRAIEALRRGAQGLAQQMMGDGTEQAGDDGDGMPGRMNQQGRAGPNDTDPLGRTTRSRDWTDGRVKVPDGDSAVARARRILDELRRRLGDVDRPRDEIEYFERLLRPR